MTKPKERPRTFTVTHESYYASVLQYGRYSHEIILDIANDCAEVVLRWYPLNDTRPPAAQLEMFNDSWAALTLLSDLWSELAALHRKTVTPKDVEAILLRLGFVDATEREWPATPTGERGRLLDMIGDIRRYDDDTLRQIAKLTSETTAD